MPIAASIDSNANTPVDQSPAKKLVQVTLGGTLALGICRSFVCGTSGTLNFIDASGATVTGFPAQQGYNPVEVQQFLTGGTASDFWAIY